MSLNEFIYDRDEALKQYSVPALIKFLTKYKHLYEPGFYEDFVRSDDLVKEITLNKMICASFTLPKALKNKAAKWLGERGYGKSLW